MTKEHFGGGDGTDKLSNPSNDGVMILHWHKTEFESDDEYCKLAASIAVFQSYIHISYPKCSNSVIECSTCSM